MARLNFRFTPLDTADFDVCADLPRPEPPHQTLAAGQPKAYRADMEGVSNLQDDPAGRPETEEARRLRLAREAAMIAEAEADVAAGRLVALKDVEAWIDSLGTGHELPAPRSGR